MSDVEFRLRITRILPSGDLIPQMLPHMQNLGNAITRRAQRLVPKHTWRLHDSISTSTVAYAERVVTTVSMGTGYGMHVEKGTSRQKAQPFMRPALLQSKTRDLNDTGGVSGAKGMQTYVTAKGKRRMATAAQIANWTRGKN